MLDAYADVFASVPVGRYLLNTIVMAGSIATLQILLALPAGYALAKLHFVGRKWAFLLVLSCLLIPAQVTFVPVFAMLGSVGLVNTLGALVLPFGVSALGTFLVRQALVHVPDEIIDRFCILGPVEAHLERLHALADLGVDQFAVYLQHDGKDHTLEQYGEHVIPALRDQALARS